MLLLRSSLRPYVVALAAVLIAIAVRALLDPLLGDQLPFYLFYFAVIGAAISGGLGPGLAALLVSFGAATYLFAWPRFTLAINGTENMVGAFRFISLGAVLVLGASWGRSLKAKWRSEVQARRRLEAEARTVQEETLNTLASIGDGLITVDKQGRITFMNAVAERLSGWECGVAHGRDITEVFQVVHEGTGATVPDPLLRSLREERVVSLPERTTLITRDGQQRAIDDSAAPIRDAQGRITGSVLVFREIMRTKTDPLQAFRVAGVELFPAPGTHAHFSDQELADLERACRAWLEREWLVDTKATRIVGLAGFNVTMRQDTVETLADGTKGVRFVVAYSR